MDTRRPAAPDILRLWLEFLTVFLGGPALVAWAVGRWPGCILAGLWAGFLGCLLALRRDPAFDRNALRLRFIWGAPLWRRLGLFALASAGMLLLTWWLFPADFLLLPREKPALWLALMLLYAALSVYPQEVIYRVFLFHRYRRLAPRPWMLAALSALAFSAAHLVFFNWVAPALTLAGGALFARSYQRHRSLGLVCLEQALYGGALFTAGLGLRYLLGASSALIGLR